VKLDPLIYQVLIPTVLEKSINDKAFIKNEAKAALVELANGQDCVSALRPLCEQLFHKNSAVCDNAMDTVHNCFVKHPEIIGELDEAKLKMTLSALVRVFSEKKRASMAKQSQAVLQLFKKRRGNGLDTAFADGKYFGKEDLKFFNVATEEKEVKSGGGSFKDFMKQKKMTKPAETNGQPNENSMNAEI
jgi:hypothetical protein